MDPLLTEDPPPDWFETPPAGWNPLNGSPLVWVGLDGPEKGRFAGLVAPPGACLLNGKESEGCFKVPEAVDGFEYSHAGTTVTAGGSVRTANIGGEIDHADRSWRDPGQVRDKYANTASRVAQVRYMQHPEFGVIAVGSTSPKATRADALEAMASAVSGDWRWISELNGYRFVGSQLVNVPGYRPWQMGQERMAVAASAHVEDERLTIDWIVQAAPEPSGDVPVTTGEPEHACSCQQPSVVAGPLGASQEAVTEEASPTGGADDAQAQMEAQLSALESRVAALEAEVAQLIVSDSAGVVAAAHQIIDLEMAELELTLTAAPRVFSVENREKLADENKAMGDGSFPIPDKGALRRAIAAFGRAKNKAAVKAHIIRQAKRLNAESELPESWSVTASADDGLTKGQSSDKMDLVTAAPKHLPAGSSKGGQFAPGGGSGSGRNTSRFANTLDKRQGQRQRPQSTRDTPGLPPGVVNTKSGPTYQLQHATRPMPEGPEGIHVLNADANITRFRAKKAAGEKLTTEESVELIKSGSIIRAHNAGKLKEHLAKNPVKGWTPPGSGGQKGNPDPKSWPKKGRGNNQRKGAKYAIRPSGPTRMA